ncbi:MAG: hypothetical protein IJ520_10400 [Synergistaceae bacterium]|nr:hypothetical protein [Synergistaceae bacterium]
MITKSVKKLLLAALAISLFASSALALSPAAPIESTVTNAVVGTPSTYGSITIGVSFDADPAAVAVAKASDKTNAAYGPEFNNLKAFITGINEDLRNINRRAANYVSEVETLTDAGTATLSNYANLIAYFIDTFYYSNNDLLKANALTLAQAIGVVEAVATVKELTDADFTDEESSLKKAMDTLLKAEKITYDADNAYKVADTKVSETLLKSAAAEFASLKFSKDALSAYASYLS